MKPSFTEPFYYSRIDEKNCINNICISKDSNQNNSTAIHCHDFHELVFILSGTGVQSINERDYVITSGDVFVLKGNDLHGYKSSENLSLFNIGFKDNFLKSFEEYFKPLPGYHALFHIEPLFRAEESFKSRLHLNPTDLSAVVKILNIIDEEFSAYSEGCELMVTATLLHLIGFISRRYIHYNTLIEGSSRSLSIAKVVSFMENNYTEEINLELLSTISKMPINSLINSFKKHLNSTPFNYINSLRLKKACELLYTTDKSVTEIAYFVGFRDSNYFCRVFKKHIGVPPGKFRKNA
jgi:AraC-like DNA-binding protein